MGVVKWWAVWLVFCVLVAVFAQGAVVWGTIVLSFFALFVYSIWSVKVKMKLLSTRIAIEIPLSVADGIINEIPNDVAEADVRDNIKSNIRETVGAIQNPYKMILNPMKTIEMAKSITVSVGEVLEKAAFANKSPS